MENPRTNAPPLARRIFVNRNLRLDTVKAIGFDMDYTLARYHRERLEQLAHRLAVEKLLRRGYPQDIARFTYDPNFVMRGLTIDKQLGNILKLDRHNHVTRVTHGRHPLAKEERRALYRREKMRFVPPRFAMADTQFALPEMSLYADLIDYFDAHKDTKRSAEQIFVDTRDCMDEAHRDNTLKSVVQASVNTYVEQDPLLAPMLHMFRSAQKKLFLLTNSMWEYTNHLMSFLLDGAMPQYDNWRAYFDGVVVGAFKPQFFVSQEPLARLTHLERGDGQVAEAAVSTIEKGCVYQGGSLHSVEQALRVFGEDVLYVGDHIYGDILSTRKAGLWRTALIVEELEDELQRSVTYQADLQELDALDNKRRRIDAAIMRRKVECLPTDQEQSELGEVLKDIEAKRLCIDNEFNAHWGMLFKEMQENSRFADQVEDYACIYTSRASNFLHYSPEQYFRCPRDFMPHELGFFTIKPMPEVDPR